MSMVDSDILILGTHFYRPLRGLGGFQVVSSWLKNRCIIVFSKKKILIPINAHLHWSLVAVLNLNALESSSSRKMSSDTAFPFLMHMDSTKVHSSTKIARLVNDWIRNEQDQSGGLSTSSRTRGALAMVCPVIAQQENGFDCGLYCCRFANGLLKLVQHGSPFIYKDVYMERSPLSSRITCNSMFHLLPIMFIPFRRSLDNLLYGCHAFGNTKKANPFVESLSTETPEKSKDSSLKCSWDYSPNRPLLQFLSSNMTDDASDHSSDAVEHNPSEEEPNTAVPVEDNVQHEHDYGEEEPNTAVPVEENVQHEHDYGEEEPNTAVPVEDNVQLEHDYGISPSEEDQEQGLLGCETFWELVMEQSVAGALVFCGTHYRNQFHDSMQLRQDSYMSDADHHCYLRDKCLLPSGELPVLEICAGCQVPMHLTCAEVDDNDTLWCFHCIKDSRFIVGTLLTNNLASLDTNDCDDSNPPVNPTDDGVSIPIPSVVNEQDESAAISKSPTLQSSVPTVTQKRTRAPRTTKKRCRSLLLQRRAL
jgi:hypothetical protein